MEEIFELKISTGEVVEIAVSDLSQDVTPIVGMLKAEQAPLMLWHKIAIGYYNKGWVDPFLGVLKEAASDEVDSGFVGESDKERLLVLNSLAAYYTAQAINERDKEKKTGLFEEATKHHNAADKIDTRHDMNWVGKGVMLVAKGDHERAYIEFDRCHQQNKSNIPAILGLACMEYHRGNYTKALEHYSNVLRVHPNLSPRVRLGIGLCFFQLKRYDRAKVAFERVLELEKDCVEALVGLGLIHINNTALSAKERTQLGMQALEKANRITKTNPTVLNHLSRHFFFKDDYDKAISLANRAKQYSESKQLQAEAVYHQARAYHAKYELDMATPLYRQAVQLWDEFPLPRFALAQMYIAQRDLSNAVVQLERVDKLVPNNIETTRMLAILYARQGRVEKARKQLKIVTEELWPKDIDAWLELAKLNERSDEKASLFAYEKALELKRENGQPSMELLNNVGALRHLNGDVEGAQEAYDEALSVSRESDKFASENVTVTYNIARLCEARFQSKKAEELYNGIIKAHPTYTDCHLRLGVMAQERGDMVAADGWFKEAVGMEKNNFDAWTQWGNLFVQKGEWGPAQKKFSRILESSKEDPYAHLSVANIYYRSVHPGHQKEQKYLEACLAISRRVLRRDPRNVCAANMAGIALADLGYISIAKELFTQVREAAPEMQAVLVNLGHIAIHDGDFDRAISLYSSCIRRFRATGVLHFLAYAYFEAKKMTECVRTLSKAVHLEPRNVRLRYNLAIAQYNLALDILKSKTQSLPRIRQALAKLHIAESTWQQLKDKRSNSSPFTEEHINIYLRKAADTKGRLEKMRKSADEKETQTRAKREERQRRSKQLEEERLQKEEEERERKRKREEEEKRIRDHSRRKMAELRKKWEAQDLHAIRPETKRPRDDGAPAISESERHRSKKKKGGHGANDDMELHSQLQIYPSSESEGETAMIAKRPPTKQDVFGDSTSEDEEDSTLKLNDRDGKGDNADGEDDNEQQPPVEAGDGDDDNADPENYGDNGAGGDNDGDVGGDEGGEVVKENNEEVPNHEEANHEEENNEEENNEEENNEEENNEEENNEEENVIQAIQTEPNEAGANEAGARDTMDEDGDAAEENKGGEGGTMDTAEDNDGE